jgi:DNA-binding LacI/PurR family transcriptional regulator
VATIRDVARLSGLSEATISYVINNGPRPVSPETRQKVLEAMRELAYHPNASARQLARQRTECIGVVLAGLAQSNFSSAYFLEYIRGISYAAELQGHNIMLLTNHRRDLEAFSRYIYRSRLVDGVLLIGSSVPDHVVRELHNADFPVVLVARRLLEHETYCVLQDYHDSAYRATHHLISRGYRRIGFLGQALQLNYGVERLEGYRRALAEAGVAYDPELVSVPDTCRDDPTRDEVGALLAVSPPPDAILTDRELAVLSLLREVGRRVPDDLALVGLDESESAGFLDVPLTTVRPPKFDIGVAAVDLLLRLIAGDKPHTTTVVLPMTLTVRASSPPKEGQ